MLFKKRSKKNKPLKRQPNSRTNSKTNSLNVSTQSKTAESELSLLVNKIMQAEMMSIKEQLRIHELCDSGSSLSVEDYLALENLKKALTSGKIKPAQQKHVHNAMEQLVKDEILQQFVSLNIEENAFADLGDIQAYALNRLPSLYATSEEGLKYQRQEAQERLNDLIKQQVTIAINTLIDKREPLAQRTPLSEKAINQYEHFPVPLLDQNNINNFEP